MTSEALSSQSIARVARGSGRRLLHVQGLRAIAVLSVVVYHAGLPLPGGFIGVDVFFVISGFVITLALARDVDTSGRIRFGRFYIRRARRLLPALALMVSVTLIASAALQSPFGAQRDTAVTAVGASTWSANFALYVLTGDYFANAAESIPLLHTWSLAVEEQFYFVFPSVVALSAWLASRRGTNWLVWARGSLVVVGALSFALSLHLSAGGELPGVSSPESMAFYSSPTRAWQFIAGALLALATLGRSPRALTPRMAQATTVSGAVILMASFVLIHDGDQFPGMAALFPTVATALLIYGGGDVGLLSSRPMTWLGDLSYSWYLWHWPFIVFAGLVSPGTTTKVIAAALSLAAAWAAFRWVEEPIRRMHTSRKTALGLVAACVSIPVALSGALFVAGNAKWWNSDLQAMAQQVEPVPVGRDRGCHGFLPMEQRLEDCTFGSGANDLILLGDSNGAQYAEAMVGAAEHVDGRAILGTTPGCPFIDASFPSSGSEGETCRAFVHDTLDWLDEQEPSVVVIANASENIEMPQVTMASPTTEATTAEAKEAIWRDGLQSVLERVRRAGHEPVLLATSPHFGSAEHNTWWNPSGCLMPDLLNGANQCAESISLAEANARQSRALRAEQAAASATDTTYLDVRPIICPDGTCATRSGNLWIYRDGLHLSSVYSETLGPGLGAMLEPAIDSVHR